MGSQQYKGKIAEHILINERFQYLHIELREPHELEFQAGQYVSVDVGGGDPASAGQVRRSYSIASAPSMKHAVELCVDITPGGKGSEYLKNLKPGDEVSFLAPLGVFVMAPLRQGFAGLQEKKLLFVATGTGIAPLRSMILDLLRDRKDKRPMWLYWGLRFVEDMFWEEEFRQMHEFFENFNFHLTLSKPPNHWPLCNGYVTDCLKHELKLNADWGVYLCGSKEMVTDGNKLIIEMGVPEEQVHFEKF